MEFDEQDELGDMGHFVPMKEVCQEHNYKQAPLSKDYLPLQGNPESRKATMQN